MIRAFVVTLLLAASMSAGAAGAADRGWIVQAGAGLAGDALEFDFDGARSASLGVAAPLRPWFLLGLEAAVYDLGPRRYAIVWPGGGSSSSDRSLMTSLAATFRLQVPVPSGPAPFVTLESGVGRLRLGDLHASGGWPPSSYVIPGETELVQASALGLGVRTVLPGSWPDVEGSLRYVRWGTELHFIEPRLSLAF